MSDKPGAISSAATELDEALREFERAAHTALHVPLKTQKHIDKAATSLNEAAEAQTRVVQQLQALMAQFNDARERYAATAEALNVRGDEIRVRAEEANALLQRFEAIGAKAKQTTESVRSIDPTDRAAAEAQLDSLVTHMASIVEDAQTLHRDAQAAELADLAQQADALRQQILSAKNKLSLAVAKRKPS